MPKVKSKPRSEKKPQQSAPVKREIVYPEYKETFAVGDKALTCEKVQKDLLGWEEVDAKDESVSPEIRGLTGKNVRLNYNQHNRPLDNIGWLLTLKQEHLMRKWRWKNGSCICIGKSRQIMDGQYRLISFVLACLEWQDEEKGKRWRKVWPTEPVFETKIAYGIEESDEVFQTMNQVLHGSPADTIYRSHWFAKYGPNDRRVLARMTDYAISQLWERLWLKQDAFSPYRTPAEAMDFLDRHPKIKDAVVHVWEENKKGGISRYVSPGCAAGLLYLMATAKDNGEKYRADEHPTEKSLKLQAWDTAEEFFVALSSDSEDVENLRLVRRPLPGDKKDGAQADTGFVFGNKEGKNGGNRGERMGALIKGWNLWSQKNHITPAACRLTYVRTYDDDDRLLTAVSDEWPILAGIDRGNPKEVYEDKEDDEPDEDEVEEIEKAKAKVHEEKVNGHKKKKPETLAEELEELHSEHPGKLLFFLAPNGSGGCYQEDAVHLAQLMRVPQTKFGADGLNRAGVSKDKVETAITKLLDRGHRVAVCEQNGKETIVTDAREWLKK